METALVGNRTRHLGVSRRALTNPPFLCICVGSVIVAVCVCDGVCVRERESERDGDCH